ncbi:MAG: hypothetical protein EON87_19270 [Brevundimonas sp.]|nr:MAG: hypothetical protein EON87_19270 [Brevundimonas sp.]
MTQLCPQSPMRGSIALRPFARRCMESPCRRAGSGRTADMSFTPIPSGSRREAVLDVLIEQIRLLYTRFISTPFGGGLRHSVRATYAIVLRDATTRFGHRSAGAIWVIIAPLLRLGGMIAIFQFLQRPAAAGDSLIIFFMTGMVPVFLLRHAITAAGRAIKGSSMMNFREIGPLEVVSARVWTELVSEVVIVFIIMMGAKAFVGLEIMQWFKQPLELVMALIMLSYFVFCISFLSAQIGRIFQQWSDVTRFLARALFFTSGVWFTMASLPPELRGIIKYNPVAHLIEWIRDASIYGFESDLFDPWYPFWFGTVCLFIGLVINALYHLGGYDVDGS